MLVSDKEKKPDRINKNINAISKMCTGKSSKNHLSENSVIGNINKRMNCILRNQLVVYKKLTRAEIPSYLTLYCDYTYNNQKIAEQIKYGIKKIPPNDFNHFSIILLPREINQFRFASKNWRHHVSTYKNTCRRKKNSG